VDVGTGLYLMWAACVCMILSVIPYSIRWVSGLMTEENFRLSYAMNSCCTWRG
jgi:hypothetical protein